MHENMGQKSTLFEPLRCLRVSLQKCLNCIFFSNFRSTTLSLAMAVTPTRWHFAAHMGQLLRYTGDTLFGPTGCSELWPTCPYSSKKLLHLSSKVTLS